MKFFLFLSPLPPNPDASKPQFVLSWSGICNVTDDEFAIWDLVLLKLNAPGRKFPVQKYSMTFKERF